ncbi:MAG: hypothetical protein DAHOPDDO_00260 [Ignavibacteriaceae bacterium]|nr:hypothetical protein [Ignavibacteriaceae bacterium]
MGDTLSSSKGDWKEYRFSDFVDISPTVSLKVGLEYSFIEMKDLQEGNKFCLPSEKRKLSGGARFVEGDTLFARITPCLENGKICKVKNLEDGVGFGSTEFLVFREKENISDNDFIFYLSRWDEVRGFAESNFEGTSGRQRVPKSCFDNLFLDLPDYPEQQTIASILSSLDDKIDLLHRQNKTLEQLAETLFRQGFVLSQKSKDKSEKLGNLVQFEKGKKPNDAVENFIEGLVPQILIETFDTGKTLYSDPTDMVIADERDILMVMDGASSGRVEIGISGIVGSTIGLFRPIKDFQYPLFLFYFLKSNEDFITDNTTGSAIPHTDKALVLDLDVEFFSLKKVKEFEIITENYFNKKQANKIQIRTLTQLRDTLLPKLMSGEVRVKK